MSQQEDKPTSQGVWLWFPTHEGGVRRTAVESFAVERVDGEFRGGAHSMWTIRLLGATLGDGVMLRPTFDNPVEVCQWVDRVFPGSSFELLPPRVITDSPDWVSPSVEGKLGPEASRAVGPFGHRISDAIREIGDGLSGGNAYEPPQGYIPPPGVVVAI